MVRDWTRLYLICFMIDRAWTSRLIQYLVSTLLLDARSFLHQGCVFSFQLLANRVVAFDSDNIAFLAAVLGWHILYDLNIKINVYSILIQINAHYTRIILVSNLKIYNIKLCLAR